MMIGGHSLPAILEEPRDFLREVMRDFADHDCTSMAAALAYVTIFSLPSLLLIVIYIAGLVLGPQAASGHIQSELAGTLGPQAAIQIQVMVTNVASNRVGGLVASALGVTGLVLSATSLLMQLQRCLNRAWQVKVIGGGLKQAITRRVRSALLLLGGGAVAIVSVGVGSIISALTRMLPFAFAISLAELATSLALFALIFGGLLKVMPDVQLEWSDVWAGGLFTAILFVLGKYLVGIYLGREGRTSVYGAAGSLALILMWTYYSFLILLLGVEFSQVWVRRRRRDIIPKGGAIRIKPAQDRGGGV